MKYYKRSVNLISKADSYFMRHHHVKYNVVHANQKINFTFLAAAALCETTLLSIKSAI